MNSIGHVIAHLSSLERSSWSSSQSTSVFTVLNEIAVEKICFAYCNVLPTLNLNQASNNIKAEELILHVNEEFDQYKFHWCLHSQQTSQHLWITVGKTIKQRMQTNSWRWHYYHQNFKENTEDLAASSQPFHSFSLNLLILVHALPMTSKHSLFSGQRGPPSPFFTRKTGWICPIKY